MDDLVQDFYAEDGQRRVNIYRRASGIFYFQEEQFSPQGFDRAWIPVRQPVTSFFDTQETAVKEASGRIGWLSDLFYWSHPELL
jgi:hypothetical protein